MQPKLSLSGGELKTVNTVKEGFWRGDTPLKGGVNQRRCQCGFRRRVAVLCGILANTVLCYGQNLATNPGFETGNLSGWFAFGSPTISVQSTQVHSGTYAVLVQNRTATFNGIAQTLTSVLQPNQTYNISAWARIGSGAAQTMQLTVKKTDAGGDQY